jgi:hypothetical protein
MINLFNGLGRALFYMVCILMLPFCSALKKTNTHTGGADFYELKLVNVIEIPSAYSFKGTTVGGLSGIDYDKSKDEFYLICDDRSDIDPSRFYKARIHISNNGIDSVEFLATVILRDKWGREYTNQREDPFRRIDPEGIRFNSSTGNIYWTNEGERTIMDGKQVNCQPSINIVNEQGKFQDSFLLPSNIQVTSYEKGIRRNGAFEGLSFDKENRLLYVSMEEPLYEDGERAGLGDSTAWVRFLKFDVATRKPVAQYAYQIDAVPYAANPPGAFKINGVPEILYLGQDKMLVIERAFSTGRRPCVIKIFLADLSQATDVSSVNSLLNNNSIKPIQKRLILNMDSLGIYIDNIEGICPGPLLPNGKQSLILVSDDNFSAIQKTQFFLFEVVR